MKRIFAVLIISVTIISVTASCGGTCSCMDDSLVPAFIGYDTSELDTVIIKRFAKGSNFGQQLDSFAFTTATVVYSKSGDTTNIVAMRGDQRLSVDSDWQVSIPSGNRTVRISEITIEKREQHCGGIFGLDKTLCINPVLSFKKDGVVTTFNPNDFNHAVYIRK